MADVLSDRTALLFDPGDEARCALALHRAAHLDEAQRLQMSVACRRLAESELDGELELTRYAQALADTRLALAA
jgi:hypothetical protein